MKKTLFIIIALLTCFSSGYGQALTVGVTGGLTVNQIDGDQYTGYNMFGVTGGAFVQTNKPGKWQMQGEIKYFLKGAEQPPTQDNSNFYKEHLNYVQIPVLVNYYLKEKIFFEAGLSAGYLFCAREDLTGNGFINPDRPFRPVELSFEGGFNYQITKALRVNIRFSHSILPIRPNPGGQVYRLDWGEYNNSLSFNLYYSLFSSLTHKK
jgi:Outer membrane protein beta-barrel domain